VACATRRPLASVRRASARAVVRPRQITVPSQRDVPEAAVTGRRNVVELPRGHDDRHPALVHLEPLDAQQVHRGRGGQLAGAHRPQQVQPAAAASWAAVGAGSGRAMGDPGRAVDRGRAARGVHLGAAGLGRPRPGGPGGSPLRTVHAGCEAEVHAVLRCEAGHELAAVRQVEPRPGPGAIRLGRGGSGGTSALSGPQPAVRADRPRPGSAAARPGRGSRAATPTTRSPRRRRRRP
jgi:hypothetical protein